MLTAIDAPQIQAPAMTRRTFAIALGIILVAAVGWRWWLLARGLPELDSDEATYGLMAQHIARGEFSIFLWGQNYMGSLESLLLVPIFALFGPSTFTLRLAPMLFTLGFILGSALLGGWLISRRSGLLAAAFLALGSPYFTILSIRAFGGYAETLLFGTIILWAALRGDRTAWGQVWLGLVIGVAIWTDFLVLPFVVAAGAIWWWQRRRDLRGRNGALLGGAALLGLSPAIIYNIMHAGATVTTVSGLSVAGSSGHAAAAASPTWLQTAGALLLQPWNELTISLPVLSGTWFAGMQSNSFYAANFWSAVAHHPVAYGVALLLGLATLALLSSLAVPLARHWRTLAAVLPDEALHRAAHVRRQYEAAVVLVVVGYLAAFLLHRQGLWAIPRYLLPIFVAVPVLFGQLERLIAAASDRWPQRFSARLARLAPVIITLPILAWNVGNGAQITTLQTASFDHASWITQDDQPLLALLRAHGVHTAISNDYWMGMRLTFESNEQIIVVMVTPEGHPGFNRYLPYVATGLRDPRPAYFQLSVTPEAATLRQSVTAGQLPGYTLQTIGQFLIAVPG